MLTLTERLDTTKSEKGSLFNAQEMACVGSACCERDREFGSREIVKVGYGICFLPTRPMGNLNLLTLLMPNQSCRRVGSGKRGSSVYEQSAAVGGRWHLLECTPIVA